MINLSDAERWEIFKGEIENQKVRLVDIKNFQKIGDENFRGKGDIMIRTQYGETFIAPFFEGDFLNSEKTGIYIRVTNNVYEMVDKKEEFIKQYLDEILIRWKEDNL